MKNMFLGAVLPNGKSWDEEIPDGSVQHATQNYAHDRASKVLNLHINGTSLAEAIKYIVGYSTCTSTVTGQPFDPSNPAAQGPYVLRRKTPARYPGSENFVATQILSVQGVNPNRTTWAGSGATKIPAGAYGNWKYVRLSVLFELPRYSIIEDADMAMNPNTGFAYPEYARYTEWDYDTNVETLARKGVTWRYVAAAPRTIQGVGFVGDRMLRQAKGILKVTTYDVHEDYVKLGRIVPTNFLRRHGTVNAYKFPFNLYRDQNKVFSGINEDSSELVGFHPGTLLLLPTKFRSSVQCHPAVLSGQINQHYFPRTVNVECQMIHFDPPRDPAENVNVDLTTSMDSGPALVAVRGHNLAPLPRPTAAGYLWYAASTSDPVLPLIPANPVPHDRYLLHQYSDFDKLWQPVESLP